MRAISGFSDSLLAKMAQHPGHVWTRDQLLELWEAGSYDSERGVDACIKRLRHKLCGDSPSEPVVNSQR